MPRAGILAYDGCYASSLGGFADLLQVANAHLRRQDAATSSLYEWCFLSVDGGDITSSSGLPLRTKAIHEQPSFDLIFIPSLHYAGRRELDHLLQSQAPAYVWLVEQWRKGTWLAANCTGVFLLAQTGVLDGRSATTTWWLADQFRERFPKVKLDLQPVITECDRLICAGASASYLLQVIRVIERFSGPVIASQTAKSMLIDVSQTTQTPYLPLLTQKPHTDSLVHRAQHWLEKNMAREVLISKLAAELATSERTLIRRFKAALNLTPLGYMQNIRIEAARSYLESGDLPVGTIAARVGYNDTSSFSRLFREKIGLSPGAYRRRFRS